MAEISYGVERLDAGRRQDRLSGAVAELFVTFADRILAFDVETARASGLVVAEREREGRPISMADAQIAAIVRTHGAALATRNVDDFDGLALRVIDPWDAPRRGPRPSPGR